jgi:hypothetical protein
MTIAPARADSIAISYPAGHAAALLSLPPSQLQWIPFGLFNSWRFAKECPSIEFGKFIPIRQVAG